MLHKPALFASFLFALLAVIIGAFGAHALKSMLTELDMTTSFETAVKYQFYHSFALAIVGILAYFIPSKLLHWATLFFIVGIVLFSGSIYLLIYLKSTHIIGLSQLGILTPIGGVCFVVGWLLLLLSMKKYQKK